MMACTKPQQWKKEEGERLRGERDQIKFIDLRFKIEQVLRFGKRRIRREIQTKVLVYTPDDSV